MTGNGTNVDLGFYPRVGSTGSNTNFYTMLTGTWYRLRIVNGGTGAVNAYVYNTSGTQLASYNYTGTVSSAAMHFGIKAFRANAIATDLVDVDLISLYGSTNLAR